MIPSTAFLDSSHTAIMTPHDTTKRQATSALEGTLCSMHTPKRATHTGTDARMTWFIESSITVRDALLHAIWKPFMTAIATRPFQSCWITSWCFDAYFWLRSIRGESAQLPNIM